MLTFLRKKTKVIMITVVVVFVATMFYGLGISGKWQGFGGGTSKDVVKVNGNAVSQEQYRQILNRIAQQFGMQVTPQNMAFVENLALGQSIDYAIILAEAKKNVKISGKEVDMAIDSIMKQQKIENKQQLEKALTQMGLTFAKFKDLIQNEMLVQKMVMKIREEAKLTPDDLREVRASHILVSLEALSNDLLKRIKGGEDFSALAKKYSIDTASAAKGGDLGFFQTGAMVEPFEKAAFSMKVGEVSPVIKTQFGYHIIKVTDSKLRMVTKGQDVEKAAAADKQNKAFQKWFMEKRSKAKVEIISPRMKGHDFRFKNKVAEAVLEYQKAIKDTPSNPVLHIFLGDTYASTGQLDQAAIEYENAIKVDPNNLDFYAVLAGLYEKTNKKEQALELYRRASIIAGDNKMAHEALMKVFQRLGSSKDVAKEQTELARVAKKEAFQKGLK
ncbi:MAG: peptidylprolyl isomerase [Candidatus Margulisiibacteriota bacterium]